MKSLAQEKKIIKIIEGTGEVLQDRSATGRLRPWAQHKLENMRLLDIFKLAYECDPDLIKRSRIDDFEKCGDTLLFEVDKNGRKRLKSANFCRIRLCPTCNWRKSLKLFSQVSEITNEIAKRKKVRYIFVTLTVKSVKNHRLSDTITALNNGFSYITGKSRTFAAAKKFKSCLLGYMKAIEITYNSELNDFHPHIHAIFELDPKYFQRAYYMTREAWAYVWKDAMKLDYVPQIDVKAITDKCGAVAEVAKYPVKADTILHIRDRNTAAIALLELYRAMFNRRLVTFGGDFRTIARELKLDDIETGDLINIGDDQKAFNPVAYMLFKYNAKLGLYIC